MSTIGYALILLGALLVRQVVVGRVSDTPSDFRDLFVGFITADPAAITSVLSARGNNVDTGSVALVAGADPVSTLPRGTQADLVREMERLGSKAKGYSLGATGPDYYDCSSIVWQACRTLGYYNGPRFTTSTFQLIAKGWAVPVQSPLIGDIVLWPTHHMGVATGGDGMYSARSTAKGIGPSTISGDNGYFGYPAIYYRIQIAQSPNVSRTGGVQNGN